MSLRVSCDSCDIAMCLASSVCPGWFLCFVSSVHLLCSLSVFVN